MFDASGSPVLHGGGATTFTRALPGDVVSALTRLPRRRLRELAALGLIEPLTAPGERQPRYAADAARIAAAHELLTDLGADAALAAGLVRPDLLPPDDPRHQAVQDAAALSRLLHGTPTTSGPQPTLSVMPAHHVVRVRTAGRADEAAAASADLMAFVRRHEMTTTGLLTTQVAAVAEAEIAVDVSISVEELVGSSGRIEPAYRPAVEVASATHDGDVRALAATGATLWRWVQDHDLTPVGFPLELHADDGSVVLCWPVG